MIFVDFYMSKICAIYNSTFTEKVRNIDATLQSSQNQPNREQLLAEKQQLSKAYSSFQAAFMQSKVIIVKFIFPWPICIVLYNDVDCDLCVLYFIDSG